MDATDLVTLAADTLVTAATTDVWDAARHGFARLFAHGRPQTTAERRLDATRERLLASSAEELDRERDELTREWVIRLQDILDESPDLGATLREMVMEIRQELHLSPLAADHSVWAGRDISVRADGGSVAATVIAGNVSISGPQVPGPGNS